MIGGDAGQTLLHLLHGKKLALEKKRITRLGWESIGKVFLLNLKVSNESTDGTSSYLVKAQC